MGIEAVQVATDDAAAEILVDEGIDRCIGRACDLLHGLVGDEGPPGAVGDIVEYSTMVRGGRCATVSRRSDIGRPTRYSTGTEGRAVWNSAFA
jgi:hypothetical protein